jgi:cation/acetate symporter
MGVPPIANGMATGADWMSAASFISMAGLISFLGYPAAYYLMGWTGGYVLLALLLAPYLRKFGKYTVPDFVGDRYYSDTARWWRRPAPSLFPSPTWPARCAASVSCSAAFWRWTSTPALSSACASCSFTRPGRHEGHHLDPGGQYCVLIVAYLIPAVAISMIITGIPIPQIGFGSTIAGGPDAGKYLLGHPERDCERLGFVDIHQSLRHRQIHRCSTCSASPSP